MKTAITFANGRGGRIVFGVDDSSRRIVGVDPDRTAVMADSVANLASALGRLAAEGRVEHRRSDKFGGFHPK